VREKPITIGSHMGEAFFKYHGLGNDFVVLDRRASGSDIDSKQAISWCDRHRGIGADGVLVLLPSTQADARMVVHNADGSIAEMCGNGIRCAVKYLADLSAKAPEKIVVDTGAGPLECLVRSVAKGSTDVEVNMGPAKLVADNLPSAATNKPYVSVAQRDFPELVGTAVSMGNPHLVLWNAPHALARTVGPTLERADGFKDRTNVEFVQVHQDLLDVVVWERGSGLTQACGTGACAVAAAAVVLGHRSENEWMKVKLPGGVLDIRVHSRLARVDMRGPAEFVYRGEL
jgi:diaminopimelate epimerase